MSDERPIVGIDVGSATVKVVVAVPEPHRIVVKGCGEARHDGARKGIVAKLDDVTNAVRTAAEEAEAMASIPVTHASIALGGPPVIGRPSRASTPVTGRNYQVSREDIALALSRCGEVNIPNEYQVLDIIPCGFTLDGQPGLEDPQGMAGRRLDASAFVLFTTKAHAEAVQLAVNRAAVVITDILFEPAAAAESVLSIDERELGCLLIDIGYATSEWVLWCEETILASGVCPVGGRHFAADVATVTKTTTDGAEDIMRQVGVSPHREGLELVGVEVPTLSGSGNQIVEGRFASQILYERAHELFVKIASSLSEMELDRVPRAGIVLTGGGARLDGLEEVAEAVFAHHTRIGRPRNLAGEVEPVSGPEWSVACGLIQLAHRRRLNSYNSPQRRGDWFNRLRTVLSGFFEIGGGNDLHR